MLRYAGSRYTSPPSTREGRSRVRQQPKPLIASAKLSSQRSRPARAVPSPIHNDLPRVFRGRDAPTTTLAGTRGPYARGVCVAASVCECVSVCCVCAVALWRCASAHSLAPGGRRE